MGNGRGGGDYGSQDETVDTESLVGSWCKYSQDLIVSDELLEEYKDYQEFNPCFHEQEIEMPYYLEDSIVDILNQLSEEDYKYGRLSESHFIEDFDEMKKLENEISPHGFKL